MHDEFSKRVRHTDYEPLHAWNIQGTYSADLSQPFGAAIAWGRAAESSTEIEFGRNWTTLVGFALRAESPYFLIILDVVGMNPMP